jgi:purine-binding chemotaxis protein CheW
MLSNKKKEETRKFMIFTMGNLNFAIAIDSVVRIIPLPKIHRSGDKLLGIATYENQEVLVIDLYKRIYGQAIDQKTSITKGFLVIFSQQTGLYGITIATLPSVEDVPVQSVQPLPDEYRDRDSLGIASHVMQVSIKKSEPQAVFLLDTELLLQLAA